MSSGPMFHPTCHLLCRPVGGCTRWARTCVTRRAGQCVVRCIIHCVDHSMALSGGRRGSQQHPAAQFHARERRVEAVQLKPTRPPWPVAYLNLCAISGPYLNLVRRGQWQLLRSEPKCAQTGLYVCLYKRVVRVQDRGGASIVRGAAWSPLPGDCSSSDRASTQGNGREGRGLSEVPSTSRGTCTRTRSMRRSPSTPTCC